MPPPVFSRMTVTPEKPEEHNARREILSRDFVHFIQLDLLIFLHRLFPSIRCLSEGYPSKHFQNP
jgi:hypothetical protein